MNQLIDAKLARLLFYEAVKKGNLIEAEAKGLAAIKANPNDWELYYQLAVVYFQGNDSSDALKYLIEGAKHDTGLSKEFVDHVWLPTAKVYFNKLCQQVIEKGQAND